MLEEKRRIERVRHVVVQRGALGRRELMTVSIVGIVADQRDIGGAQRAGHYPTERRLAAPTAPRYTDDEGRAHVAAPRSRPIKFMQSRGISRGVRLARTTTKPSTRLRTIPTSGYGSAAVNREERFSRPRFLMSRSCMGVRPAASMSWSGGSEILPSGRTASVRESESFFQTVMCTSSGPMMSSVLSGYLPTGATAEDGGVVVPAARGGVPAVGAAAALVCSRDCAWAVAAPKAARMAEATTNDLRVMGVLLVKRLSSRPNPASVPCP